MSSWFQDQPHLLPEGKEDDAAALGCSVAQYVLWLASVTPESASCMRTRDAFRLATFKPHFVRKFIDYISPNLIYLQKCLDGVYEKGWPILPIFFKLNPSKLRFLLVLGVDNTRVSWDLTADLTVEISTPVIYSSILMGKYFTLKLVFWKNAYWWVITI